QPTLSPSMDIQVSSNFERLLFDLYGREGVRVADAVAEFRRSGRLTVGENCWRCAAELFHAESLSDEETLAVIAQEHAATGELLDPHTAIGVAAARALG